MNLNRLPLGATLVALLLTHSVPVLAASASATKGRPAADSHDRRVRIINETRHTMMRFYASNVDRTDWEEDILGESTLSAGGSVVINIDDGTGACLYDFKGVFDDGEEAIRNRINVCEIDSFRFTDG
jgi:hypothetical protein